jgi:hypothetical protein
VSVCVCRYHARLAALLAEQVVEFEALVVEFVEGTYEMTELGLADAPGAALYVVVVAVPAPVHVLVESW